MWKERDRQYSKEEQRFAFYLERVRTTANNAQITPMPSPTSTPIAITPKQVKNHTTWKPGKQQGLISVLPSVHWR